MKRSFIKMHGLGNDFVIFDARVEPVSLKPEKIRFLSDRRTGIGCDQLVIIEPPRSGNTDVFLRIYNADGGEVGACGNATRCVAHILLHELKKNTVHIEKKAEKTTGVLSGDNVSIDMGKAHLEWKEIPLSHEENTLSLSLEEGVLKHPVAVNVGNPHAVFFMQHIENVPLETLGPRVENHPLFPEKVNVEIANIITPSKIRMRVWERGVGITRACGTGACAVAVAGVRRGLTQRKVTVSLDGGDLEIEWRESDGHIIMTGPVAEVFRGEVEL